MTRTLAVVPAYNEVEALPATLGALHRAHPDIDVVVVDDGSRDATAAVAAAGGATVLRLPYNLGIGGALRAGFRWAIDEGYTRAIQFDADGQHDPAGIASLLAALDAGADLVIGSRFAESTNTYEVGRIRRRAMGLLRLAVRLVSGQTFTDTSSGFRGFSHRMLVEFSRSYPIDYLESTEALLLAAAGGFRIMEVPVPMHQRQGGEASSRRFHLAYHYVRLLFVMAISVTRRHPVLPTAEEPAR